MRTIKSCTWGLVMMLFLAVWNVGQAQDSLGMHHVATLDYWPGVNDIQMVGNLAYMCSYHSGLRIMDLSDPSNPVEIGRSPWSPCNYLTSLGVYVNGNRAYLTSYNDGRVLDVSDPAHPMEINHWYLENSPIIKFVRGDVAVGISQDDTRWPYLLDVSDWNNVQIIMEIPGAGSSLPVGMVDDYLCLAGLGVSIYDISDPWSPVEVATVDDTVCFGWSAKLSGNYVYVSTAVNEGGVWIYDVSNPLQPVRVAACDTGWCGDITVTASQLFVSKMWDLNIWHVTDPTHPVFASTYLLPVACPSSWIASSGNMVCAALYPGQDQTVAVLDVSNPASPVEISRFGEMGYLGRLVIEGTAGYVSDIWDGFHVINLADPSRAFELGRPLGLVGFDGIAVRSNYVYGVDYSDGLTTYSVANPANPEWLSCWQNPGHFCPNVITIVADYAWVMPAEGSSYSWIFSLSNPASPILVDSVTFGATHFRALNGYLYGAAARYLYTFDIFNPALPQLIGSCTLPFYWGGTAKDFAISSDYAYVAYYAGGVQIIDIANPELPAVAGSVAGSYVTAIAASGNTLAFYQKPLNYQQAMIYIMDLTDPIHPQYIGHYNIIEEMSDMEIYGSYLLTVSPNKFAVYQVDALSEVQTPPETPHEFALYPCYPNPFNNTLTIPFTLPIQSEATIIIFNILGQKVHQFAYPPLSPGAYRVLWDAGSCASGVYIIQLISSGKEFNQKALLIK